RRILARKIVEIAGRSIGVPNNGGEQPFQPGRLRKHAPRNLGVWVRGERLLRYGRRGQRFNVTTAGPRYSHYLASRRTDFPSSSSALVTQEICPLTEIVGAN